ncbi:MAG TPA: hypothetical protein VMZ27_14670 [Candidatus Saccharimonadales bacterium]|nr:hypothetical protein [Candidatus Saccharimonadales bacterium]
MRLALSQKNLVVLPGLDGTGDLLSSFIAETENKFETHLVRFPKHKPLVYQQFFPCIREVLPWGKPYSLLADSFSGHLALLFAEDQPQYLESIILCSSFFTNPSSHTTWWNKFTGKDPFKPPFTKEFLKKYLFGEDCPEGLLDKAKEVFDSVPPEILEFRWNLAMKTESRRQLSTSNKPILFLAGNQDALLHEKHLADLALMQPKMEVMRFDAPHALLQRFPREAAAYVDAFIDQKLAVR